MSKNSGLRLPNTTDPKIIKFKVIFAFFSVSLLLFGSNALMMGSYAQPQPQKVPSQGEQLLPQLQQQLQQQQLAPQLQLQQELQDAMQEKGGELRTKKIPNGFELDEEFSVGKVQQILNQTLPSSPLKAQILGPTALGAATENQALQVQPSINTPPPAVLLNPPSTQPVSDIPPLDVVARGCIPGAPVVPGSRGWVTVKTYPYDNVVAEGEIGGSRYTVVHHDYPFNHKSHDNNFHVLLDPKYNGLASTAVGLSNGKYSMNQEWEIGTDNSGKTDRFPKEFWPWEGDRVWMNGKWVYDCLHFKVSKSPPFYYGYKTEIHPPFATAFTRNEPTIFPGENRPSSATVTYIYIHGQGGNFDTPVGGQNYQFDIPILPKPCKVFCLPTTQLHYRVIGLPFGGPAPIVIPNSQLCNFGGAMTPCAHVVIPLSSIPKSTGLKYGAAVAVKWIDTTRPIPEPEGFRTLRVTFDSIKVNTDHDDLFSGEWNHLWVGVNGKWIELSGPSGHYGLDDVDNGQVIRFPTGSKGVTVIVPENGVLKIQTSGWESDPIDDCFGKSITRLLYDYCLGPKSDNDEIGILIKRYDKTLNFGIGLPHDDPSERNGEAPGDTYRDFNLRYRIQQIGITPPTEQPPVAPKNPTAPTQPSTTRPPPPPPEQQLPPICKLRPWLPQCKDLM